MFAGVAIRTDLDARHVTVCPWHVASKITIQVRFPPAQAQISYEKHCHLAKALRTLNVATPLICDEMQ